VWWARAHHTGGELGGQTLFAVLSAEFPAGMTVDLPDVRRPARWQAAVQLGADGQQVHAVEVNEPDVPLLWYVELPEPTEAPAATSLVAFSDSRQREGRLLTAAEARDAGVTAAQQVAAVRWWPGTGLVHQLYVGAQHRGHGLARKLVQAAYALQACRGLPALHGDGRRTDLGEVWRRSLPDAIADRMAPLSQVMPPMTPESDLGINGLRR
jgi:GNAT superfamily N-acetyltransferase